MTTIIYYFTGTGNSLTVAKKIAAELGETELVQMRPLQGTTTNLVPKANRIGIVCPVYFAGLPSIVALFAQHLTLSPDQYVFGVVTLGGFGVGTTIHQLDDILNEHTGRGLDAGFGIKMPGNYILLYNGPSEKKKNKILSSADKKLVVIMKAIAGKEKLSLPRSYLFQWLLKRFYNQKIRKIHDADRLFTVSDNCTSCGTCASVCPTSNIQIVEGKPSWSHNCEMCCGCIQLCPTEAIQAGKQTVRRRRYRHPAVTISDLRHERK